MTAHVKLLIDPLENHDDGVVPRSFRPVLQRLSDRPITLADLHKRDFRTSQEVAATRCMAKAGSKHRCQCGKPQDKQCGLGSVFARNTRVKRIRKLIGLD